MALEQQHVNSAQLLHVPVLLELLTDLGADCGHGHTQGVHGLDLRGLYRIISWCSLEFDIDHRTYSDEVDIVEGQKKKTHRTKPFPVRFQHSIFRIAPVHSYHSVKSATITSNPSIDVAAISKGPRRAKTFDIQERVRCARYVGLIVISNNGSGMSWDVSGRCRWGGRGQGQFWEQRDLFGC